MDHKEMLRMAVSQAKELVRSAEIADRRGEDPTSFDRKAIALVSRIKSVVAGSPLPGIEEETLTFPSRSEGEKTGAGVGHSYRITTHPPQCDDCRERFSENPSFRPNPAKFHIGNRNYCEGHAEEFGSARGEQVTMFISPEEAKAKGPGAFEPRMNIREEVEGTPKKGPWDALVESWYPRDLVGPNDLAPEDRVLRAESRPKLKRLSNATMNSTGDPLYDNYFSSNPVSQWENKNDPFGMLHGPGFGGIYGNPFAQTAYRTSQEAKLHQLEASDPTYGELPWWQKMQNSFNPTKYIDGRTQYGTIPSPLQPYNPTNINESPLPNDFMRRAPATGFPAESPESNAFFKAQDQEEKAKIATLSAQGDYYASSSTNPQEQQQLRTLSQVARAIASGPLNQIDPSLGTVVNQIDRSAVSANVKSLAGKLGMYTTFLK